MRQKQSHAEAGGYQDSGSQLAKPAGPEEELETVGQTQDFPVEGSANTWTISVKSSPTSDAKDIIGWAGSSREGKGPGGHLRLQDEERKEDVFFILYRVHGLVVSRGECRSC